jgi:ribosomal-protein-alanine N-acetyltransferase
MIRQLSTNDFAQIVQIADVWNGPQFWWPEEQLKTEFANSQAFGSFGDQNESGAELLEAFALIADRTVAFEITCLATRKESIRQGHMSLLLEFIIQQNGHQKELWLEVHENNLAARNLYEKWGFEKAGERPSYYKDGKGAVLYTRKPS